MDRWKHFVNWCQQPSKIKIRNFNPRNFVVLIATSIILVSSISFATWNLAITTQTMPPPVPPPELPMAEPSYIPGVSPGDYVIYGNFKCNFSHPTGTEVDFSECLDTVDWKKMEVLRISGKEVTLRYTELLKSGSASSHNGCVHVIEDIEYPSWINGTCKYAGYYFGATVVAANLTEGDWIHSSGPCPMPFHEVGRTEIRTYLGVNRWVNIMRYSDSSIMTDYIFDVESGVLLEYEHIGSNDMLTSYRVVETNIFSSPSPSPASLVQVDTAQIISSDMVYVTTGVSVILIVVIAAIAFMKRRLKGGEKLDEGKVTFRN